MALVGLTHYHVVVLVELGIPEAEDCPEFWQCAPEVEPSECVEPLEVDVLVVLVVVLAANELNPNASVPIARIASIPIMRSVLLFGSDLIPAAGDVVPISISFIHLRI